MARAKFRKVRRDNTGLIWCAVVAFEPLDLSAVGGKVSFPIIIVDSDINTGGGQAHATLLRIRGWVHLCDGQLNNSGYSGYLGGVAVHHDDNPNSPESWASVNTYIDEDVLTTFGGGLSVPSIVQTGYDNGHHHIIDVKAKRKLRSGQNVTLSIDTPGTNSGPDFLVSGALRALVKLS